MEASSITIEKRVPGVKRELKALRRANRVPCEMYGESENLHFSVDKKQVRDLIYTPDFKVAKLDLGGESYRCIIKEIQFHPVTEEILHIDFLELAEGRKVKVQLPVRFKGTSPGVRNGGRLIQQLRKVEIKTTPDQLVEELILDISNLKLGNSVRVRDIEANDEIEILTNPGIPVATVKVPRVVIEEEEVVPGEVEGEEGAEEGEAGGEPKGEESSSGE